MQTGHIPAYTSPTSYNKQSQDFCIQKDRKYKRLQKLKSWMLPMLGLKVVEKKLLERITKNSSQNDLSLLEIFPPSFHSSFDVLDNEHLPWLGRISEACVHLYLHKRPQEEKKNSTTVICFKNDFFKFISLYKDRAHVESHFRAHVAVSQQWLLKNSYISTELNLA